uniref:TIL domain-containing protein n=1 Tax=Anopheles epiroticus TaxID=199890 RepID=A0A182P748_9DIPT
MRFAIRGILLLITLFALCLAARRSSLEFSNPCLENRTCANNEEFICCGPCAEPTCSKAEPESNCASVCIAGCFCRKNYIRRTIGGPCILQNSCPKPMKATTKKP